MKLNFDGQPKPRFKYAPAVSMGPFIKTAGMVGLDPQTNVLVTGGAVEEFAQILRNLRTLMDANALKTTSIMSATIYVTAFHMFPALNEAWNRFFAETSHIPARSSVGVSHLPIDAQVEADFLIYQEEGAWLNPAQGQRNG